jgi:hypothetical protein
MFRFLLSYLHLFLYMINHMFKLIFSLMFSNVSTYFFKCLQTCLHLLTYMLPLMITYVCKHIIIHDFTYLHTFLCMLTNKFTLMFTYVTHIFHACLHMFKQMVYPHNDTYVYTCIQTCSHVFTHAYTGFHTCLRFFLTWRLRNKEKHTRRLSPSQPSAHICACSEINPLKILKPYDNSFWEKRNRGRRKKKERKKNVDSGHLVPWQRTQAKGQLLKNYHSVFPVISFHLLLIL